MVRFPIYVEKNLHIVKEGMSESGGKCVKEM